MRGVDLGRGVSRALGSNRGLGESLLDRDDVLYAHLYRHFVALAKFQNARRNLNPSRSFFLPACASRAAIAAPYLTHPLMSPACTSSSSSFHSPRSRLVILPLGSTAVA